MRTARRFMLTAMATLLLAAAALAQQKPAPPAAGQGVPAMQGVWGVITINGQSITDGGMSMTLTITGEKYAQEINGNVNERGIIKVDTTKKPMTIDFTILEGDDAGKPQVGLVEVTGESMTMKLSQPGNTVRPTSMSPEEGFFLVTAKKSK